LVSRTLGGENCRITAGVRIENEESVRRFLGSEFAMVYGDYEKRAKGMACKLGVKAL